MNAALISNGQLTGQGTALLVDGTSTRTWTSRLRSSGKTSDTISSVLNLIANSFTLLPRDLMRSAKVVSGPTGSGLMSFQDRVSRNRNLEPVNTNAPSKRWSQEHVNQNHYAYVWKILTFQSASREARTLSSNLSLITSFK